jgi:hypothetical protein
LLLEHDLDLELRLGLTEHFFGELKHLGEVLHDLGETMMHIGLEWHSGDLSHLGETWQMGGGLSHFLGESAMITTILSLQGEGLALQMMTSSFLQGVF